MKRLRVLVVEDEPANQEVAVMVLRSHGHDAVVVDDGVACLDLLLGQRERFDLVLMDVLMPNMDGLTATQALRADPGTRDLPIMCVSARASGADRATGLAAGCDHYLVKPYRAKQLMTAIAEMLASCEERRAS